MGRAIIGGVVTSTLLTLIVVPVLYSYLVRERKGSAETTAAPTPAAPAGASGFTGGAIGNRMPAAKE
jgi:hypothetical protein